MKAQEVHDNGGWEGGKKVPSCVIYYHKQSISSPSISQRTFQDVPPANEIFQGRESNAVAKLGNPHTSNPCWGTFVSVGFSRFQEIVQWLNLCNMISTSC